jgi:hypothetical protein
MLGSTSVGTEEMEFFTNPTSFEVSVANFADEQAVSFDAPCEVIAVSPYPRVSRFVFVRVFSWIVPLPFLPSTLSV